MIMWFLSNNMKSRADAIRLGELAVIICLICLLFASFLVLFSPANYSTVIAFWLSLSR